MMAKIKWTSCILLLLASLAVAAGCNGTKPTPEEITESVLMERVAAAHAASFTYQYDLDGSVSLGGDVPSSLEAYDATYRRSAVIDNDNGIGWLSIAMKMDSLSQVTESGTIEVEMYFSGDWTYLAQITDGEAGQWIKYELPAGYWQEVDIIHQPLARLEDSEISITGDETVDGTDCYVVAAEADKAAIWEVMINQLPLDQEIIDAAVPENMASEVTATYWIAGDTFRLMQERLRMVLVMTPPDLGISGDADAGIEIILELNTVFSGYDTPVSIEIPAEALEATVSS